MSDERAYFLALNKLFLYDPKLGREIIESAGSVKEAYHLIEESNNLAIKRRRRELYSHSSPIEEAILELEWAQQYGIEILTSSSKGYPKMLLNCPDYPLVLYKKGEISFENKSFIGIVGTRRATPYGKEMCKEIVKEISATIEGAVIVSGLAFGIDIEAHVSSIEHEIPNIAVLGCGLESIYPASHARYTASITSNGALITEFPKNSSSHKINFLRRNRIIAGMCDVLIVVESAIKGGAMITASLSLGYNREVFAVPGKLTDRLSEGCNTLISTQRASLFISISEMAKYLGWQTLKERPLSIQPSLFSTSEAIKEKILVTLSSKVEPNIDTISKATSIPINSLLTILLEMEMEGKIYSLPGRRYSVL